MGLLAGDRPCADVEVLAGAFAVVEYELARRMHAATTAGSLPLVGPGAVLAARGWHHPQARRLARTGALAAGHPALAGAWAAGIITSEHVDALARNTGPLTTDQLAAVISTLEPRWGQWSPPMITRFVLSAIRLLHPPTDDPSTDEADAHSTRDLSFALLGDTVILSGTLPRLEGEAVIAAIDALAERLRSTADHTPAGARRADALIELVNTAATAGALPTRGGLPVALTVTLEHTQHGDPVWTTSRGHLLTPSEQRFTACDPTITPIAITTPARCPGDEPADLGTRCPDTPEDLLRPREHRAHGRGTPTAGAGSTIGAGSTPTTEPTAAGRVAALAALLFDGPRIPLAVGRTSRTATPAQRKALAARDGGCIIPGCRSRPRTASPTTCRTGPPTGHRTSTTWRCSAGPTTARSTSACGPSNPPHPEPKSPNHPPGHPPEHPGPPTTAHPGPSAPNTAPAGDCERCGRSVSWSGGPEPRSRVARARRPS